MIHSIQSKDNKLNNGDSMNNSTNKLNNDGEA